jgi:cytochrome c peroxidase
VEIARVSVLALANADSPVAERGLPEGASALVGISRLIAPMHSVVQRRAPHEWRAFDSTLTYTTAALARAEAGSLDRLDLTRTMLVPLAEHWSELRNALDVPLPPDARPWRASVASVFGIDAFDAWQFAPSYARAPSHEEAAQLGAALFIDTRLSGDGTRSCVTCHDPSRLFTDGRSRSLARTVARQPGAPLVQLRNAPTLVNAALQRAQFADARATFLEDQVTDVVQNAHELGGALHEYAKRLGADPVMHLRFARSFGAAGDSTVTPVRVAQALAAYERTLIALDAPFDRYLRGDTAAMAPDARRGYSVFMGKGKCGTCHFAPLFNGTVPPVFARSEVEIIGTPSTPDMRKPRLDADSGRARVYASPGYLRAFKTPTLRNVALTAPYMHNGVFRTLDDVVEFYARGGGAGLGLTVPNQTLPFDKLQLSARDKRDLVAFMHALTDVRFGSATPPDRAAVDVGHR